MIKIENLSKSYGRKTLFSNISFTIGDKERCALYGRNGSGKSTLLKILTGIEESDDGTFQFPKGLRIGALPQHLTFEKETLIEEACTGLTEDRLHEQYKVEIILSGLGFSEEDYSKPPSSFSGGYQLRIALCKVLALEPELLLLDEPTNYLDILAIRWLETFLKSWEGQIIFVSHDRSFVNKVCTHVLGIKRSDIKKVKGNLNDYHSMIEIQEETHERSLEKQEKKKAHMQAFVDRFGAKASKAAQAKSKQKAIDKLNNLQAKVKESQLSFRFNHLPINNKTLLKANNLNFSYNEESLIQNFSLEVENGKRVAIIGKNGSGKSTLLKLLVGELTAKQGDLSAGENTTTAYFGQTNIDRLNGDKTIEEELSDAFPSAPYSEIRKACGAMMFPGDDAKKRISLLSGGEKSRVLLAKILLTPANLLLLDEPTHHLDMESVDALMEAIQNFKGAVVLVSHDETVLNQLKADQLIVCHKQKQEIFLGNYKLFLKKRGFEEEFDGTKSKPVTEPEKPSQEKRAQKKEASKIETKIARLEKKIEQLETLIKETTDVLSASFTSYVNEHAKLTQEVETLYGKLQTLDVA